jgi:hypothetical protein
MVNDSARGVEEHLRTNPTKRRSNMSAVIPFILERTAAHTAATAVLIKEQLDQLKLHNKLLKQHNAHLEVQNKLLEEIAARLRQSEQ